MTTYVRPRSLAEAVGALAELGAKARILAGGTDLMVPLRAGVSQPLALVNVFRLDELRRIEVGEKDVRLGAAVTVAQLLRSKEVLEHAPLLWKAADRFASPLVRARATVGGNLCNASPAADLSLALWALDAKVVLQSHAGVRELAVEDFVLGVRKTALLPTELLVGVRVPRVPRTVCRFEKSGTRPGLEISAAAVAFSATARDGKLIDVRIACGAVAPTPMRAKKAEALALGRPLDADLVEACAEAAAAEVKPIDDVRATARHRRRLVAAYVRRCLESAQTPKEKPDAGRR